MQPFANNSFYLSMHAFSGLTFGAFEYAWMLQGLFLRLDVLIFLALATCPLAFLCARKSQLSDAGVRLYSLARPYRHILADFLFYISTTGTFSILVSMYSKGLAIFDREFVVPPHTALLMGNFVLFAISVYAFSWYAGAERNVIDRNSV